MAQNPSCTSVTYFIFHPVVSSVCTKIEDVAKVQYLILEL